MLNQYAFDSFLKSLENTQFGKITITAPNGKVYNFEGKNYGAKAQITLYNYQVITNAYAKGDIGFAEDYRDGNCDSENLTSLVTFLLQNENCLNSYIYGKSLYKFIAQILYILNRNTIKGSKRNIHAHYDLGNKFYKLWLDETMTYSSALFTDKNNSLVVAQNNKYDRILERIGTKNSNIIEIGCGWGGFAERAIEQKGHKVKGITISEEQHKYAANRLSDKNQNANIVIEDYRKQEGKFDNIVSIEMFEAVGEKYWKTYFEKVSTLLKEKGTAIIQTITIKDDLFDEYRCGGDMIRSFIFPGGMLPSQEKFKNSAEKAGLKIIDKFLFGKDYAATLNMWLNNFDNSIRNIRLLGFDEKFIRIWRLYLSLCSASFITGRTNVMQVELQHA